jgi:hypothetical protein
MPTLGQPALTSTATLRPPGAVPPPPSAPPALADQDLPVPSTIDPATRKRPQPDDEKTPPGKTAPGVLSPENVLITEQPGGSAGSGDDTPLPSFGLDEDGGVRRAPPPVYAAPPAPQQGPPLLLLGLGGLIAILVLLVAVLVVLRSRPTGGTTVTTIAPTEPGQGGRSSAKGCTLARRAKRLAPRADVGVPPFFGAQHTSGRIAIGFAETATTAKGITLDPSTLDADEPFREAGRGDISGVVPLTSASTLGFDVNRAGVSLSRARTIDGDPKLTVGFEKDGVYVIAGGAAPKRVWELPDTAKFTVPSVARVAGTYAVTFRRGGQSGKVVVGFLEKSGVPASPVHDVAAFPFVGTPEVAGGGDAALVSFAARQNEQSPWGIQLVSVKPGTEPSAATRFVTPPDGPGGETISPAARGLDDGSWILQFTEGESGSHAVRAQTLGGDLEPRGAPIDVSPPGANAGKGAVWVTGKNAVSLFFVKTGNGHELWGAPLTCP